MIHADEFAAVVALDRCVRELRDVAADLADFAPAQPARIAEKIRELRKALDHAESELQTINL
jgi:hypothetical protein